MDRRLEKLYTHNLMKFIYPPTLLCDFYKVSHREQYPENTQKIYSTWTPRASKIDGITNVVAFGFQAFLLEYSRYFNIHFFSRHKEVVVNEYKRVIKYALGIENPDTSHIEALHDLGYLPIRIKAIREGNSVPLRVPMLTIENTKNEFFWLTNYLETLMSLSLWKPSTSATLGKEYRKILDKWAIITGTPLEFVQFQGHDFSMRGMDRIEAAAISGAGHLLSFTGTDTIPAIHFLEEYYNANIEKELVGTSIPASEHSVMCAYGQDELASYERMITKVYPTGFVSIVSDTWDLWGVLNEVIKPLKDVIMNRDGRVVIRPDSGDPVKIICGDPESDNENERKGVIQILWEIFGGTTTETGYKLLDSHIGCIYGDAITLERCEEICKQLADKGFASGNMVYGIGSFTYQYNTRDTFGFALKSTYAIIDGEEKFLFKDPVTDKDKIKKSQKGMVAVRNIDGVITLVDGLTYDEREAIEDDLLEDIFLDGEIIKDETLADIRKRIRE